MWTSKGARDDGKPEQQPLPALAGIVMFFVCCRISGLYENGLLLRYFVDKHDDLPPRHARPDVSAAGRGALSSAFIPVFTQIWPGGKKKRLGELPVFL